MQDRKFYIILTLLMLLGYFWIAFHFVSESNTEFTVCLFKRVTTIPCPACGTSSSVLSIISGDYLYAAQLNPLGYLVSFGLLLLPFWLGYDLISRKKSFYMASKKFDKLFGNKKVFFILGTVVVLNWVWNIYKTL